MRSHRRRRRDYHTDVGLIVRPFLSQFRRDDEDLSDDVLSPTRNELNPSSRDSVREFADTGSFYRNIRDTNEFCHYFSFVIFIFMTRLIVGTLYKIFLEKGFIFLISLFNILLIKFSRLKNKFEFLNQ